MLNVSENPTFIIEHQTYHIGNDAVNLIQLDDSDLPDNTAVKIGQSGEHYLIHVLSYIDSEATTVEELAQFNNRLRSILSGKNMIDPNTDRDGTQPGETEDDNLVE